MDSFAIPAIDNASLHGVSSSSSLASKSYDDDDDAGAWREEWHKEEARLREQGASDGVIAAHALAFTKRRRYGMRGGAPIPYAFWEPQVLAELTELGHDCPETLLHHGEERLRATIGRARAASGRLRNVAGFITWDLRRRR
jgi:hypothetical protein